ncbi:MAG: hypothetical protein R3242_10910, partial [Akkermansiaceae bacterium]|nr:hypothetical protein [Akkermansiaceae bacterium]
MKSKFLTAIFLLTSLALGHAQEQEQPGPPLGMLVFINPENGQLSAEQVYILAVTDKAVAYKFNAEDAQIEKGSRKEIDSIFIYTPKEYLEALDLLQGRKYAEARDAFAQIKERYAGKYPGINNNLSVMAGYYELEALRKLGDLEGLRKALMAYDKEGLTRKVPLQQLEIYVLWDAIRAE